MKIVIPDRIDMSAETKQKIHALGGVVYDDVPRDSSELIARIRDAELITANYIDITKEIIDSLPKLHYIVVPAVGYEWIDVVYAAEKGIVTVNCPTFNGQAVAEHALALMLAVSRKIVSADSSLENGKWDHAQFAGFELTGKTLGLVGYGNIGRRIEHLVSGFDMPVIHVNSKSSDREIDELVRASDVVCICAPLTPETRHMFDARRLKLLQKGAVLINVGRGAIVDQPAMRELLLAGSFRAAGLDVFENEPLSGRPDPSIVELAKLPNIVATPHMAYNTQEASERLGRELLENMHACIAGRPINQVG